MPTEPVTGAESQDPEATGEPVAEGDATRGFDETTWKKRLAGKDQALTAAQRARDEALAQIEELNRWKAERENADLTEYERAIKERDAAKAEAAAAMAIANRERLARKYPLAVERFDENDPLPSEETLAALQEALAVGPKTEAPPAAPRVDPNNPPRRGGAPAPTSKEAAMESLRTGLAAHFGRS